VKPLLRVLGDQAVHDLLEEGRDLRVEVPHPTRFLVEDPVEQGLDVRLSERVDARHDLVEQHAQAIEVRSRVDLHPAPAEGLRRRVLDRPREVARLREADRLVLEPGHAEVHDLDLVRRRDEHVLRLEVAMDHARSMDRDQPPGDLASEVPGQLLRDAAQILEEGPERLALHELHDQHVPAAVAHGQVVAVETTHHVVVIDLPAELRLAEEALEEVRTLLEMLVHDLERDARAGFEPVYALLDLGQVDGTHPPGPELAKHAVGTDSRNHGGPSEPRRPHEGNAVSGIPSAAIRRRRPRP